MKHLSLLVLVFLLACAENKNEIFSSIEEENKIDKTILPSWNEGTTKQAIIDFVEAATNEGSPGFIPQADRIAVFDNDGCLWSEKPMYFQLFFAIDMVNNMAADHPEWKEEQPFKAILEQDQATIATFGEHEILQIVMATHAGYSTEEFSQIAKTWMSTATHPTTGKPYTEMVFKPMLELLEFLRDNGFTTFIVSGGGVEFMRVWAPEVYGIPSHQIIGSTIKTEFVVEDGTPEIRRLPEIGVIDDKEGKPLMIQQIIGKKPVFCAGNSDGDLPMMKWTASNELGSLMLYIHHTDSEREWAYDRNSSVGRLDKGLDEAMEKGWTIVDMAADWKVVY
jgi:phosphoserine phosphatase